jgi:signal transduction histidine kinase
MAPAVDISLRRLRSQNPTERLEAARYFADHAGKDHEAELRKALSGETVLWIRTALKRAISRISPADPEADLVSPATQEDLPQAFVAQLRTEAIETTAGQLIHEIEPILGTLRLAAEREVPNFEQSDTRQNLDRFDDLIAALSRLRRAAAAPKIEEFALDALVETAVGEVPIPDGLIVHRRGPHPFVVEGDASLIKLCLSNGLRNAIEATVATGDLAARPITITWNGTDVDNWIAIVDNGIGFKGNLKRAFDIGTTTKAGHFGMGLAIADQAMSSLSGTLNLVPSDRGIRFEMRWPKTPS